MRQDRIHTVGLEKILTSEVSKQMVKNKFHQLNFPVNEVKAEKKTDYLYINADEDKITKE